MCDPFLEGLCITGKTVSNIELTKKITILHTYDSYHVFFTGRSCLKRFKNDLNDVFTHLDILVQRQEHQIYVAL